MGVKPKKPEEPPIDFDAILALDPETLPPRTLRAPCGLTWYDTGPRSADEHCCDGVAHYDLHGIVANRCPELDKAEVRRRVATERARLAGHLAQLRPGGFQAYDPKLPRTGGPEALKAMLLFASGPHRNVLLTGGHGVGKGHLFLAAHFRLLHRGVHSVFVETPELRTACRLSSSYDEKLSTKGRAVIERVVRARAVLFADAADTEGDERKRGDFAEGLKELLDRRQGLWAVATNRSADDAAEHPDLDAAIVSRLKQNAEVVHIDGDDQRAKGGR